MFGNLTLKSGTGQAFLSATKICANASATSATTVVFQAVVPGSSVQAERVTLLW